MAVTIVVVSHIFPALRAMGQNGVVVFFVLSGFLITSLLAGEVDKTRRIRFAAFYLRRILRLAPALFVLLGAVALGGLFLGGWWTSPRALIGAATWTTNYVAPSTTAGAALAHTWSLAIEEQFYLAWPILLLALVAMPWWFQRLLLTAAVFMGIALPFLLMNAGPWHVYYGTDTRTLPLISGSFLALAMRRHPEGAGSAMLALASTVVVVAMGAIWTDQFMAGWVAPPMVTGLAVLAIWAATQTAHTSVLSSSPFAFVGQRSYGLYLWHPVVLLLIQHLLGLQTWLLALVVIPLAWLFTLASWRFVEQPALAIRHALPGRRKGTIHAATSVNETVGVSPGIPAS